MGNFVVFCFIFVIICVVGFFAIRFGYLQLRNFFINKYLSGITIDNIDSLDGRDFEQFLYYLLSSYGFKATITPSSHDYGADLLLKYNDLSIAVQCKNYYKHAVGVSAIQEAYSASKYYNTNVAIVITNSHFSRNAVNLATTTNVILWDRDTLIQLMSARKSEKNILLNEIVYSLKTQY
ncbi:MAG: restriction endonuclease [Clostridiales bacterium]|nr:restriction endonuclease [Clostridiales bacterium]